jgi:hypothetical protein
MFLLAQKGLVWYPCTWKNEFMIMNIIEETRHKGGDHGNRNQRPVNG